MAGGIRIAPYQPLGVRTPSVPGGGYIHVNASVGKFESSPLLPLGLRAAEGAAAIATEVSQHLARDDEAVVKDADARLGESEQALLFDPQDGYFNTQGEAALTKAPEVLESYTRAQEREVEALPSNAQRQMFEELAQRRLTTFGEQVERHSAAERQRWYDEVGDRRIAQMRADAGFYWSDDALLRRALGTTRAEVRDKAERHGWDSPLTEAALRQQTSRILVSAIEAAVERDPGRAQALRTRYATVIEDKDRAALDALLAEAQTRQRAQVASTEILNAAPPAGEQATPPWRLRQAEAIADPDVRAATVRRLLSAAAADEARARAVGEQVLARVLEADLTDSSQIPVRDWVALDADRRQAIETRLDHNARGTEPAPNPALVDALATEMTQAPITFARRDLVPAVALLPLPRWQRFRDWQAGLRRNDRAIEDELHAIKRGLRLAQKMMPEAEPAGDNDKSGPSASALDAAFRAALVEEIDTAHKLAGTSPDDAALREMVRRRLPDASFRNIGMPPMEPQLARRLGALPGQAIDALSGLFLMMLLHSIILQSKVDRMTGAAPQSRPPPIPPSVPPVQMPPVPAPTPPSEDWSKNRPLVPLPNLPSKETFPQDKPVPQILPSRRRDDDEDDEYEKRSRRWPAGARPIDETEWSGDHLEIKDSLQAGPTDVVLIGPKPDENVWLKNPDGSYSNHGPARTFTGSGRPKGRRGQDREQNR